jgi:hypothetical protein
VTAAVWIAAYVATVIVWLTSLGTRSEPTLLKGRSFLLLNVAFVVASVFAMLIRRERAGADLIAFDILLLVSAILARSIWLLLHIAPAEVDEIIERCFTQTRARYERTPNGYSVSAGSAHMAVTVTRSLLGALRVRFSGARESKKAELIRALIGKQFRPSYPTLRIRT